VTGLEGRTALVTGAAQGIGHAIAERLAAECDRVFLGDVNVEGAERAAAEIGRGAEAIALDVRDESAFEAAFEAAGRIDVLVNNAALTNATPIWEIDVAEWDDVLAVNLRGVFFGCRVAATHMRENGYGRIVNLASIAGQWGRSITGAHYAASKAGILALTRMFAFQLGETGVTVNAVAPGPIDSPQTRAMPPERIRAYVDANLPVKRLGQPSEVAEVVRLLASEECGFVTGATFDVNGGAVMR
jgi:3-oxoacyl-[acyl-carrier protein] reductase